MVDEHAILRLHLERRGRLLVWVHQLLELVVAATLTAIQRLRRRSRSLIERLDAVRSLAGTRPAAPTPLAIRAVEKLAAELSLHLASHLREEECLGCQSFTSCRSYRSVSEESCQGETKPARAGSRQKLLQLAEELRQAPREAWPEVAHRFRQLDRALREHFAAEEAAYHSHLLAPPLRPR